MELKNYTRVLVENKLDELFAKSDICDCKRCKADVTAIALNELKPKYVVSEKGECYAKLDLLENQISINIISAITKAMNIVSKNPRH